MRKVLVMSLAVVFGFCSTLTLASVLNPRPQTSKASAKQKGLSKQTERTSEILQLMKSDRELQLRAFHGTMVHPAPDADGPELDLQQEIAGAFWSEDSNADKRLKMFLWCSANSRIRITGWLGTIKHVSKSKVGHEAKVEIFPRLAGTWMAPATMHTSDYCFETWKFSDHKLGFVSCEKPTRGARFLMGD